MAQHFLLSAAARTLSLKAIFSEGEDAAYQWFCRLRWSETNGAPICPLCGCIDIYHLATRRGLPRLSGPVCPQCIVGLCAGFDVAGGGTMTAGAGGLLPSEE